MTPKLDLHGIRHRDVQIVVENFLFTHEMPARIIAGNSAKMKQLVMEVLSKHGYAHMILSNNLGQIVVLK